MNQINLFCPHCFRWFDVKLYAGLFRDGEKIIFCAVCGRALFIQDIDYPKYKADLWSRIEEHYKRELNES